MVSTRTRTRCRASWNERSNLRRRMADSCARAERLRTFHPSVPASRGLSGANLALCQQMLSAVPTYLYSLNKGLSTLQFQSLSVAADNPKHLQGGTQDNGTFETTGSAVVWPQIIYGDGGQSGFNVTNSSVRFNSFFGQNHDANFQEWRSFEVGHYLRANSGQPGRIELLCADHR